MATSRGSIRALHASVNRMASRPLPRGIDIYVPAGRVPPRVPLLRVTRGQQRSLMSPIAEYPQVSIRLVSALMAARSNGHVRPWRHRGFPGRTPSPDQHLGVLLEDRRFPEISGCSRRWWGAGPMSSLRRCPPSPSRRPTRPETPHSRGGMAIRSCAESGWVPLSWWVMSACRRD